MDLQHVLYNTVGDTFEQYLECKDLNTMRKVTKITRETDKVQAFKTLMLEFDEEIPPLSVTVRKTQYDLKFIVSFYDYLYDVGRISKYSHALITAESGNNDALSLILKDMHRICDEFQNHLYSYMVYLDSSNYYMGGTIDSNDIKDAIKSFKPRCDPDVKEILEASLYDIRDVRKQVMNEVKKRQLS